MISRTPLAVVLMLPLAVSACGFHPLYGDGNEAASAKLPDIFVQSIPDRAGQELRLALQQRLAGTSEAEPQGYLLAVSLASSSESIGIHGDNTSERNRVVGRAHWSLSAVSPATTPVASGDVRSVDGYNVINEQYFAASIASETTQQRIANNLADAITLQLATWFTNHRPPATAAKRASTASFLTPSNVPGDTDQTPLTTPGEDGLPSSAIGRSNPTP
ncbi:hypothetical protein HN018_20675 [Lichenicola cladoniae]|uniref:Lipoprotein n=1 Tax=Lichenicola cladoniae TaxID=1484109 RepID=A0A6M8HVF7_9PROT|nr:LPS assembly lipoprotein LptE [Lichenicola cladoniae]NPD69507.1 hypothetical protein [Acetobacteraceae bacterium]QKE92127.1 hypothetical protein HN018_20675 [Lichenicola cladoniae]